MLRELAPARYDKDTREHALTWIDARGFSHMVVGIPPEYIALVRVKLDELGA